MASGFTRPVEGARSSVMELANKARSGAISPLRDYGKGKVAKSLGVKAANGAKLRKS